MLMNQMYQIMIVSHFIAGCEAKKNKQTNKTQVYQNRALLGVWVFLAVAILAVADSTELLANSKIGKEGCWKPVANS